MTSRRRGRRIAAVGVNRVKANNWYICVLMCVLACVRAPACALMRVCACVPVRGQGCQSESEETVSSAARRGRESCSRR